MPITYSRSNHDNWFERCLGKKDESVLDDPINSFQKLRYRKPVTVESTEAGKSTTIPLWDDNNRFLEC